MIKLIVGLGNPGPDYAKTRHNAGFWFIEAIANQELTYQSRFKGLTGQMLIGDEKVHLLMPETFMNKSGESVLALAHFYKILPQEIVVVHDELDLAPGMIRLKKEGGHGGHNGLRSIITCLSADAFLRLRVGIGHPGHASMVANYVLKKAPREEEDLIFDALYKAKNHLLDIVLGHYQKVMNELHR